MKTIIWRPMTEAPDYVDKVWLRHPERGIILAEGKPGRWYCPNWNDQVWTWDRPSYPEDDQVETFVGWFPFDELVA